MLSFANLPAPPSWLNSRVELNDALNSRSHKERWKYTRPDPVLQLLAEPGHDVDQAKLPAGVTCTHLQGQSVDGPGLSHADYAPEAHAALHYQQQMTVLTVSGAVREPLKLHHHGSAVPLLIKVQDNASVEIQETCAGGDPQHQTIWLQLGNNSRVVHARNSFSSAVHWQYLHVLLNRDAHYHLHNHATGSELHRQDVHIVCAGHGAHAQVQSAAFIEQKLHLDQQITVEHQAAHTSSEQTFHNIAADGAKVTFNGRIHIHRQCAGVAAELSNKNLSLGDRAVINTKPELEIYTDDVKCAHGATVGRLDDAHLFYFASRGIGEAQARQLLSQAFLNTCTAGPLAEAATDRFGHAFQDLSS